MERFKSVWDAITDDPAEAASLKQRSELMIVISETVKSWRVNQTVAAARLGITQPRLSDLMRGKVDNFSLGALVDIAQKALLNPTIMMSPVPDVKKALRTAFGHIKSVTKGVQRPRRVARVA